MDAKCPKIILHKLFDIMTLNVIIYKELRKNANITLYHELPF